MEKGTTEITDIVFSQANEVKDEETTESAVGGAEEEKNSGGLINSLISNLVAPLSPKVRGADHSSSPQEDNGGGIFNSLVSSILHQTGGEDEREGGGGDGSSNGGGLIETPLPTPTTPVADDAGLATDEASILIHSIVHD